MTTTRPSADRDHAEIVTIGNSLNPDGMARSVEDFRSALRKQPPLASAQSYVAETGGQVIGDLWLNRLIYVPTPHVWYADIQVPPSAQGRGIGSQLYAFLLDRLAGHRAQQVYARVREDLPLARALKHYQVKWARHRGVDYLFTENDVENAPMLRINTDMGYQPLPADVEVIKDL